MMACRQVERQIGQSDPSVFIQAMNRPCRLSTAPTPLLAASHSGSLHVTIRLAWMMTVPSQTCCLTATG